MTVSSAQFRGFRNFRMTLFRYRLLANQIFPHINGARHQNDETLNDIEDVLVNGKEIQPGKDDLQQQNACDNAADFANAAHERRQVVILSASVRIREGGGEENAYRKEFRNITAPVLFRNFQTSPLCSALSRPSSGRKNTLTSKVPSRLWATRAVPRRTAPTVPRQSSKRETADWMCRKCQGFPGKWSRPSA